MRKQLLLISLVLIFGIIFSGAVSATDIYVNTTGSDTTGTGTITNPYQTIGMGVSVVDTGGTVKIADGTYTGDNNRNITVNKTMTIQGQSTSGTIINTQQLSNVFIIPVDAESILVNIYNLTFINGKATRIGGAIQNEAKNSSLNVINCNFNNNQVFPENHGGAIYNVGTMNVINCSFTGNNAPLGYGGAIFASGADDVGNPKVTTVINCIFTNNQAGVQGGAIYNGDSNLFVINSTFTSNQAVTGAEHGGGAIFNNNYLNVVNSTFTSNSGLDGGAIYNAYILEVTRSIFNSNSATTSGGAIFGSGDIHYNSFANNVAPIGSAIYTEGDTFAENNWWGSNAEPNSQVSGPVYYGPWILMQLFSYPSYTMGGGSTILSADFTWNTNDGTTPNEKAGDFIPDGLTVTLASDSMGSVSPLTNKTVNGNATTIFTAGVLPGYATVNATLNSQTVPLNITIMTPVDLTATDLTYPNSPYTGLSYQLSVIVRNIGSAVCDDAFDVSLKDNGDVVATQRVSSILNPGNFITLYWNWIPAIGTPGVHTLQIVVDALGEIIESNETNNFLSHDLIATGRPDFIPTNVQVPINPYTGVAAHVNVTVLNNGDAAATDVVVRLKDNGSTIGTKTITSLGVGESNTLIFDWTPLFGSAGLHTLLVEVDPANTTFEINDTNNNLTNTTTAVGRADLQPTIVQAPVSPYTGLQYPVNVTVINTGDAAASNIQVRLKDNGNVVDTKTITSLAIGGNTVVNLFWTPTIGMTGLHTLLVEVDPLFNIVEVSDANNNLTNTSNAQGRPDLIPTQVQVPTNPYTLETQQVNVTITNTGDAAASNIVVRLKDNGNIIGTQTITSLAIGGTTTLNFNWTPLFGTTGLHTLLVEVDPANTTFEISDTNNNLTNATTAVGRPDLINNYIEAPATPYTFTPQEINVIFKNIGDAAATAFKVELFDNGSSLGTQNVSNLGIGATYTLTWNWIAQTVGSHTLLAFVDALNDQYEINETNNQLTNTSTAVGRPDLVPTTITTNSSTMYTGLPYTLNVTVINNGDANAGSFNVELFDGSTSLGTQNISSLNIGETKQVSFNWFPTTAGAHNLKAVADSGSSIIEINETNNNKTQSVGVTAIADLIPTTISSSGNIYNGVPKTINVTVWNNGTLAANNFNVKLFEGSTEIGTQSVGSLAPGATTIVSFTYIAPTSGTHTLLAQVDPNNSVQENHENNNELIQSFSVVDAADLVPTNFQVPITTYLNVTYNITCNITNNGTANAGPFTVKFYEDGIQKGRLDLSGLNIGTSTIVGFIWKPITIGTHILNIKVDSSNTVAESIETNNENTKTTDVTQVPDLVLTTIQTPSGTVYQNLTYTVNATILNNGTLNAGSFNVKLYDGASEIDTKTVSSLDVGATNQVSFNWTPHSAGSHELRVQADPENAITESFEDNNEKTSNVLVTSAPDLIPLNIQTPSLYLNVSTQVNCTLTNNGTSVSGPFNVTLYDGATKVSAVTVSNLNPGENTQVNFNWTPNSTGNHTLIARLDSENAVIERNETNNDLSSIVSVISAADLVLTNLQIPINSYLNVTYNITCNITNNGTANAGAFNVKFYEDGVQKGRVDLSGLLAGASTIVSFTWKPTATGVDALKIKVDTSNTVAESNELNNEVNWTSETLNATDLVILSMQTPSTSYVNRTYTITGNVSNVGNVNAGAFTVKFYDGAIQIGRADISSLAAGASTLVSFSWKPTSTGIHTLKIKTDTSNTVTEGNETNNELIKTMNVVDAADLTLLNIQTPNNPYANITYTITGNLSNIGSANAGAFTVKLYDGATQIGRLDLSGLNAGASTTVSFNWKPTTTGTHTLKIKADTSNTVTEGNETNNEILKDVNVNIIPDLADLVPLNIQTASNIYVNHTYTVTCNITNNGTENTGAFTVKFYDGATQIGRVDLAGLAQGASTLVSFTWNPNTAGTHSLKVKADTSNTVTEINEYNNEIIKTFDVSSVMPNWPDLIPTNMTIPPTIYVNQTYNISCNITNNGTLDAGAFSVKLYQDGLQVGRVDLTGLALGTSTIVSFNWKPTTTGTHTLKIKADTANAVTETDENNNEISRSVSVSNEDPIAQPLSTVKLTFMHHSCGSNWLATGNGNLGVALNENNYYVTDTNYGWDAEPNDNLGDHTDTSDWDLWFNDTKMPYVYNNNAQTVYTNTIANPGGENEIIMFKSCYPLSEVGGSIDDEKAIYNDLKTYFAAHPDKMFILITPPGEATVSSYQLTRDLCNWLVDEDGWLSGYTGNNVYVFDFYCVLSEVNSHHRYVNGQIEHVYAADYDGISPYHNGDDHPNSTGNQKATDEFIEFLNYSYNNWQS